MTRASPRSMHCSFKSKCYIGKGVQLGLFPSRRGYIKGRSLYGGGERGIFPTPRAFVKGERYIRLAPHFTFLSLGAYTGGEARHCSMSQSPMWGELVIFPYSRAFIKGERYISRLVPRSARWFVLLIPKATYCDSSYYFLHTCYILL